MRMPFTSEEVVVETALPHEEVSRRLRERTGSQFVVCRSRVEYPVAGRVGDETCQLFARPPIYFHNSFIRVLALRFEVVPEGTVLRGVFRLHRFVAGFMSIWFTGVVFGCVTSFVLVFRARGLGVSAEPLEFIPVGMLVFGVFLVNFGVWLSRSSEPNVIAFLHDVLDDDTQSLRSGEVVVRPRHDRPC